MGADPLLSRLSREFLRSRRVYRFRMKAVQDMTDNEVIRACHWYCEENRLSREWNDFRLRAEAELFQP